jgi:hypothetical protein
LRKGIKEKKRNGITLAALDRETERAMRDIYIGQEEKKGRTTRKQEMCRP